MYSLGAFGVAGPEGLEPPVQDLESCVFTIDTTDPEGCALYALGVSAPKVAQPVPAAGIEPALTRVQSPSTYRWPTPVFNFVRPARGTPSRRG